MPFRAGFAEADITPPKGTRKIGWLKEIIGEDILDPLFARVAVLEDAGRIGIVQLDTLSVRWNVVRQIRRRVELEFGFPGECVMVSATHNHGGPAIANCGDVERDEGYIAFMIDRIAEAFGRALAGQEDAEIGFGRAREFNLSFNRRVVMRDGTVRTHGRLRDPDAMYIEGPIDPEVNVMAVRRPGGCLLGAAVNFTCHPTHHGGEPAFTAGYPGALAAHMKWRACPVTLFLNGACGNVSGADPMGRPSPGMDETGLALANHVSRLLPEMEFRRGIELSARAKVVDLPFREPTEKQVFGRARGAQRFIDPEIYDRNMPKVVDRIERMGTQPAEVQALFLGEHCIVGVPAEYFVEYGLRIKLAAWPKLAWVAAHTNGMVGYVPTREAFERGGYETTFADSSRMAPEAGEILCEGAIGLIREKYGAA